MMLRLPALTSAAPLLYLGLQKIARTPTPRLAVAYKLVPRREPYVERVVLTGRCNHSCELRKLLRQCEDAVHALAAVDDENLRPTAAAIYRDFLLAAGTVGEILPLANRRIEAQCRAPAGEIIDLCV